RKRCVQLHDRRRPAGRRRLQRDLSSPLVPENAGTQGQEKKALDSRFRGNERKECYFPRIEPAIARGSRTGHVPASAAANSSDRCVLNAAGSSRLILWPAFGITTSAAVEMFFFIRMPGSRQGQSSSPVMISVGAVM